MSASRWEVPERPLLRSTWAGGLPSWLESALGSESTRKSELASPPSKWVSQSVPAGRHRQVSALVLGWRLASEYRSARVSPCWWRSP